MLVKHKETVCQNYGSMARECYDLEEWSGAMEKIIIVYLPATMPTSQLISAIRIVQP